MDSKTEAAIETIFLIIFVISSLYSTISVKKKKKKNIYNNFFFLALDQKRKQNNHGFTFIYAICVFGVWVGENGFYDKFHKFRQRENCYSGLKRIRNFAFW